MDYDKDKVDEMALALLYIASFEDRGSTRAWKGMDWEVLDRLHLERIHRQSEEQGKVGGLLRGRV